MTTSPPELFRLAPPVYFLSDAHLGAATPQVARNQVERLHGLLNEIEQQGRTLVIVGDLFDFWYEWKFVIPKQHIPILFRLKVLLDRGIAIHYLAGNHDFRLHGFLETIIGLQIHSDAMIGDIQGQRIFIFHGDGVLTKDHGYRMLRRVLRNRLAQRGFSWIHPDLGMRLARGTSVTSRKYERGGAEDDRDYLAFAQRKFGESFDGVVMGHTHRPLEHHEGSHTYVNLGDWITRFTYGLHDGTSLRLLHWRDDVAMQAPAGE
jgi:UDP-2,3-diacylglucosamine hydrolase